MKKKASLICTTLNCKDELYSVIEYFAQEKNLNFVNEFIIVDGGSTDGTWELLSDLAKQIDKLSVFQIKGANISQGRNEAIKRAKSDIIITFDSGTKYCEGWLEKMLIPFEKEKADVVGALTICCGDTLFERCLAAFGDQKRAAMKPSHRGCAFYKRVWEEIGGYPEHVQAGEDTWFNDQWAKRNYKYVHVPDAKSFWKVRGSWKAVFKMQRRNTTGHIYLCASSGTLQILLITSLYFILLLCLFLGLWDSNFWILVALIFGLYTMKRLFGKGRWRYNFNPINYAMGIYILTATDFGSVFGLFEGTTKLLLNYVRKKL